MLPHLGHEQAFTEHLEASGHSVTVIDGIGVDAVSVSRTSEAMKAGAETIAQGALEADGWTGRADILRRIGTPSQLGPWSYEIIDAKLARETKGGTVLQLCLYSDLLCSFQGLLPEFAYVVAPWSGYEPQAFRMLDYAAYYRRVRTSLEKSVAPGMNGATYPDPKDHCEICRWAGRCDTQRRRDDHLCLVANIAKLQINELKRHRIDKTAQLAVMPLPLPWKPDRGAAETYERGACNSDSNVRSRFAAKVASIIALRATFGSSDSGAARLDDRSNGDDDTCGNDAGDSWPHRSRCGFNADNDPDLQFYIGRLIGARRSTVVAHDLLPDATCRRGRLVLRLRYFPRDLRADAAGGETNKLRPARLVSTSPNSSRRPERPRRLCGRSHSHSRGCLRRPRI
jgi:hypothetical protein